MNKNIITATEVAESLSKNEQELYFKRFPLGRDVDYNEFSPSIEKRNLHTISPFKLNLSDLVELSIANSDLLNKMTESRTNDRMNDIRFSDDPEIIDMESLNLEYSLSKRYLIEDNSKLDARTNIDIQNLQLHSKLYNEKEWDNISKLSDSNYILLNRITFLKDAYTNNRNLVYMNRTRTLGELFSLIKSDELRLLSKEERPQIYSSPNGIRPDNTQYHKWNGLQVFDLDLKYSDKFKTLTMEDFPRIKQQLYDSLKHYHWFAGIGFSSSGMGIHIYTKVARPHQYYIVEEHNEDLIKYWYRMSYTMKYSAIRYVMENVCGLDNGSDPRHPVVDFAMAKMSQGVRVAYDKDFIINDNFEDLQPIIGFHIPPIADLPIESWLLKYVENDRTFQLWDKQNQDAIAKQEGTYQSLEITYDDTEVIPNNPVAYGEAINYVVRYNVCNTLASFFGESGRVWAHIVLASSVSRNQREIDGMYNTAVSMGKTPSRFGLSILSKSGFDVKVGDVSQKILISQQKNELTSLIERGATSIDDNETFLKLNSNEYLGMFDYKITEEFKSGKANLIISPPGTGKTEFVKKIAEHDSVLLVLPYISVIDAKVIKDNDLGDNFDVYYGDASTADLKKGRSAVMTVDKLGRLDVDDILYMYKYIIIDESHLLFTSSFRLEAMANALKNIKKITEAGKFDDFAAKMVLMTGTPTGEEVYFNYYDMLNVMKITKDESRTKSIEFVLCNDSQEMQALIANQIANAINNGKRVLYPTNSGDIQAHKLVGMVEHLLSRPVKWSYYKKSNSNSEMYESINDHATVGEYELILASNYLSVGIDIKDMLDFEIIYDSSFSGYEIEQFNCRLRNVDIISKIYIPVNDAKGDIIDSILNQQRYSIDMTITDRDTLRDYVDISMKKLELSMVYDPITNQIYTPGFRVENGQMVFKLEEHELTLFEERFIECMQTPFFISQVMAGFGYKVTVTEATALSQSEIKQLISIGLDNAKIESEIRNDRSILTFEWLIDNDTYNNSLGMEFPNLVNRIWKDNIIITEDPTKSNIEVEESLLGEVVKIIVPDRRIFDEQLPIAARFLSLYSPETCKYIFGLCIRGKSGKINKSEISRYMRLMQLIRMEERGQIGLEIYEAIKYIYEYMDNFYLDTSFYSTTEDYNLRIEYCLNIYLERLGLSLRTQKMQQKFRDEVTELFTTLCKKSVGEYGIRLQFRILPTPDSVVMLKKREYQSIMLKMFNISDIVVHESHIKSRHTNNDSEIVASIRNVRNGKNQLEDISPL